MKTPKGFGKNYFTLQAIQATVNEAILSAKKSTISQKAIYYCDSNESDDPPDLDELLEVLPDLPVSKRCNCVFNQKCRLTLKRAKLRGKPKCNCKHLNHRKTGIAPPSFNLF